MIREDILVIVEVTLEAVGTPEVILEAVEVGVILEEAEVGEVTLEVEEDSSV